MQPVKDLLQDGMIVHFEGLNERTPAMWRIQRYITRTDAKGRVWGKTQALSRQEALRCATINGAKFITEEDMLGSIEKGKYGEWTTVDGWQGTVETDGTQVWWVDGDDYGTGPFRWLAFDEEGGEQLGLSDNFNLPEHKFDVVAVEMKPLGQD